MADFLKLLKMLMDSKEAFKELALFFKDNTYRELRKKIKHNKAKIELTKSEIELQKLEYEKNNMKGEEEIKQLSLTEETNEKKRNIALQEMRQSINGAITIPQLQNTINVVSILYEKLGAEKIEQLLSEPRKDDSKDTLIKMLKQSGERTSPILQNIWANMLAAETEHPGTITRKLVNTVEELPENTIILFKRICKNIMLNSERGFIMINIDKNNNNLQVYKNDNVMTEIEYDRVHKDGNVITEIEYKELFEYGILASAQNVICLPRDYTFHNDEHYEIVIPLAPYGFLIYYELSISGWSLHNYINMEPDDFNSDIVDIYNMMSSYVRKPEEVVMPCDYGLNIPLIFKKTDSSSILYPEEYKGKTLEEFWEIKAKEHNFKSANDMLAQMNKDKVL